MNVISPVTAVLAAIVPVFVGVAIGERPARRRPGRASSLGLLAVVLVSRTTEDHPHGRIGARVLALAFLSGVGFGLYFVFLARAGHDSGLWPLLVSRVASAIAIVPLAAAMRAFARGARPAAGHRAGRRRAATRWPTCSSCSPRAPGCCRSRACSPRSTRRSRCCSPSCCCTSTPAACSGSGLALAAGVGRADHRLR